jgi:hypothetical protein
MKLVQVSYTQLKDLVASKGLFLQYKEAANYYDLFAVEANVSWECNILKDSDESADFESTLKALSNKPLEYRSVDGLQKVASAKFADTLSLYLDGENLTVELAAGETKYVRKHYADPYTLSGVDSYWTTANWGDYIDFEIGVYTDLESENSFISLNKFANQYKIFGTNKRLFDVPAVKVLPPTVEIAPGVVLDTYIRAKCVNTGASSSKIILNLVGWL